MIFVDLGAYDGDTVEQFVSWGQVFGDISDATVYAFEPQDFSPRWDSIKERQEQHVKEIIFDQKAAWTDDKGLEFSIWEESKIGSTVMKEKRNWYAGRVVGVPSFDFSKWLKQFEGEEIYIKFDVEGAEYPILEKMIKDGTDKLVKLMFIEWHADKMGQEFRDKQKWIEENLSCKWLEWR